MTGYDETTTDNGVQDTMFSGPVETDHVSRVFSLDGPDGSPVMRASAQYFASGESGFTVKSGLPLTFGILNLAGMALLVMVTYWPAPVSLPVLALMAVATAMTFQGRLPKAEAFLAGGVAAWCWAVVGSFFVVPPTGQVLIDMPLQALPFVLVGLSCLAIMRRPRGYRVGGLVHAACLLGALALVTVFIP